MQSQLISTGISTRALSVSVAASYDLGWSWCVREHQSRGWLIIDQGHSSTMEAAMREVAALLDYMSDPTGF